MYDTKLYLYDTLFYHNISCKTMSYHRKLYHIVTYYPIRYQIMIQYHIIWYNMILYNIKVCFDTYHTYDKTLCHIIHYCHIFYNSKQYHIIYAWYIIVSHTISYSTTSYLMIHCKIILYSITNIVLYNTMHQMCYFSSLELLSQIQLIREQDVAIHWLLNKYLLYMSFAIYNQFHCHSLTLFYWNSHFFWLLFINWL